MRTDPAQEDKMGALNLTVLIIHGLQASRRYVRIGDAHKSNTASFLKEKVLDSLNETPDEVVLLDGENAVADSQVLPDKLINGDTALLAMAIYKKPKKEWQREDPRAGMGKGHRLEPAGPLRPEANGPAWRHQGIGCHGQCLQPEEVAELLSKPRLRQRPARELAWTVEETRLVESGHLVELPLQCRIIMGQRWHQRFVSVPVPLHATVGRVKERLTEWLGSAPDEMVFVSGDVVLETDDELEDCQIDTASTLTVMASYQDTR